LSCARSDQFPDGIRQRKFTTVPDDVISQAAACPATSPSPARPAGSLSGQAVILTAAVLWGTTGTASTFAPAGAPSAGVGSAGLALGGLLLFITARTARSRPRRYTRGERWLLLLGAAAVAGYPVTFYPAVSRCGVAVATVIALGSAPVFTGLLAWLFCQARPTARWACATVAAVAGLTILSFPTGMTRRLSRSRHLGRREDRSASRSTVSP
jgi:DME family drug/metabolite transporter